MTPRERAESLKKLVTVDIHQDFWDSIRQQIEQAILADRQALQSEIVAVLEKERNASIGAWLDWSRQNLFDKIVNAVQSVFAQQLQPEEGKPDTGYDPSVIRVTSGDGRILYQRPEGWTSEGECQMRIKAESDRRVLAEREACAKAAISWTSDYREVDICHKAADAIRARSNQPEGKSEGDAKIKTVPIETHENLDAYAFYVEKVNDWQAQDTKTIQELNASNNALSEKIAQLEKDKHGLIQKNELLEKEVLAIADHAKRFSMHGIQCLCCYPRPANRKA